MSQFDFKTHEGIHAWLATWEHDLLNTYRETFGADDQAIGRARVDFVRNLDADLETFFDPKQPSTLLDKLAAWLLHYESLAYTNAQHYGEEALTARIPQGVATIIKLMYRQVLDD